MLEVFLKAILFDADGVIQRPAVDYRQAFTAVLASRSTDVDSFVHEIFAAERRALNGRRNFVDDLAELLARRNLLRRLDDVLALWTAIETDQAMFEAIASLRNLGYPCYLASNQEAHRARYMTETLRYRDVFHGEYYSHLLGIAKPNAEYFRAIIAHLRIAPEDLLLIDDNKQNVAAARNVGLHAAVFPPRPRVSFAAESPAADRPRVSVATLRTILLEHGISWP